MERMRINQATMAYLDTGCDYPLVMGHSFLWDANMWRPQIAHLQQRYRCIVPDLWSHGQSDPLPQPAYSIEQLADDYWQLCQTLLLKKFALIGLSVGGMWATQLTLQHPEAVSALVLMDTYVGAEPQQSQRVYLGMMDELERNYEFTPKFAAQVAPYFFARDTAQHRPELVKTFVQSLHDTPPTHIIGKIALGRAIFNRSCLLEQLRQIKIPTLIIVGEEDLPRPPREAQEMLKHIPNAQLAIIPRAGHICTMEQPEYVNDVLTRFLNTYL